MTNRKVRGMQLAALALLLVSIIVLYITHKAVPFMMDDLWYSTMLFSEEPIRSFGDIVESQIWHYHNWGGRSIAHGMLQMILLMGENFADVLNVAVTLLLGTMICVVAGIRKKEYWLCFLLAAIGMLLGFNANWKMSMFWQAGAANYLYITVFLLVFLYCYLREIPENVKLGKRLALLTDTTDGEAGKNLPGITLWILPLGVIVGWSNENMGPMLWIVSLLVILLCRYLKKPMKPWMLLGNLACLAGSVMVVIAPGNFVRSEEATNHYGTLWNLFLRCYAESKAAVDFLFPALLFTAFMVLIGKGVLDIPIGIKRLLLLLGALLSWGAMVLSPHYPDRATFGTMVLLICVSLSYMRDILQKRKVLDTAMFAVSLLVWMRGMYFLGEFLAISWGWIR